MSDKPIVVRGRMLYPATDVELNVLENGDVLLTFRYEDNEIGFLPGDDGPGVVAFYGMRITAEQAAQIELALREGVKA